MDGVDITAITTAISTVGFPIFCCCVMFYLYNKIITTMVPTLEKIEKAIEILANKSSS